MLNLSHSPAVLVFLMVGAAIAAPALAYRVEFEAQVDGHRQAGSEVCFFPAKATANPFDRLLASNDVRCLPADDVIEIPPGIWNYFLRHSGGFVSAYTGSISNMPMKATAGPYVPELGFRRITIELRPAGILSFEHVSSQTDEHSHFVAYYPLLPDNFGSTGHPIPHGSAELVVPADMPVVPLLVRDRKIVRIYRPTKVSPGGTATVQERVTTRDSTDVVFWLKLDRSAMDDEQLRALSGAVEVQIGNRSEASQVLFSPPNGAAAHDAILFGLDLKSPPQTIAVGGVTWEEDRTYGPKSRTGRVVSFEEALMVSPAAFVRAQVETDTGTPIPTGTTVRILSCPRIVSGSTLSATQALTCTLVSSSGRSGMPIESRGLPVGNYAVEVSTKGRPTSWRTFYAAPGQQIAITIRSTKEPHSPPEIHIE